MKSFDKQIKQVYNTSYKDELFVVEDIKNIISEKIFNKVDIYVLVKDFTKKILSSSLSIAKYKNEIKYFDSIKELDGYLKERNIPYQTNELKRRNLKIYGGEKYPISLIIEGKTDPNSDGIFDKLLNSLCEIVIGTINYDNISMEHNQRKIEKLEKKIIDLPDFAWRDFCKFINEEEKTKVGYFVISPQEEIKNEEEKEKKIKAGYFVVSLQKEINVNNFISDFELPFLDKFQTKDGYKVYKPFFKESILSGKSIAFFDNSIKKNYIAIIPAIERYQAPKFIKEIFIIWSEQRIKKYKISVIKDYIDCLKKQERLQKTSFLSKIQAEVIEKFKGNGYNNKNELLSDFKIFSEKCLKRIIKTTYAHSAVVRLYNASKNTLAAFTVECNKWGKWNDCEIDDKKKDIKLKLQHCSVNAFVFAKALTLNLEEQYVYIDHLKKPIPEKYKKNGLNDILMFRKNSMSEICFPLFIGKVPFGVLNIESPIIDAFDDDIHYLLSIKQTIESFYDISIKTTDSNWLAARSPVYKNVHEIKQLLDSAGTSLTEYQLSCLKPLILFETNDVIDNKEITLDVLKEDIDNYLKEKTNDLNKNKIHPLYWNIKTKISISSNKFEKIKLIAFNLIENIIKHSNIKKDSIDFSIDFTSEKIPILKMKIITYGTFGEDNFSSLTFSPVMKCKKYHYGMFLVGMLSRNLGGTCYIEEKEKEDRKFTLIETVIPLR